ncbi:hypothetical protein SCRM01_033 [Synechococcus phage S-CRM01]|uniref:hypothetical protein n=1 Tax=Synechococcus phage S-CRM01 TaxID=1026955 RepID=UPI000209E34B|nr:hypothetical protein SCRM01_033 [Synechococcus phage S-CRM01]AEC52980.1 hypothetical protein SCRM01_033 [Synechococcus phage S-CRM01]
MRTFESFLAEADEMGLQSRLQSGQVNPQQAKILAQRRAKRDSISAQKSPASRSPMQTKTKNWIKRAGRAIVGPSVGEVFRSGDTPKTNTPKTNTTKPTPKALPPASGGKVVPSPAGKLAASKPSPGGKLVAPPIQRINTKTVPTPQQKKPESSSVPKPPKTPKEKDPKKKGNNLKKAWQIGKKLLKNPKKTVDTFGSGNLEGLRVIGAPTSGRFTVNSK